MSACSPATTTSTRQSRAWLVRINISIRSKYFCPLLSLRSGCRACCVVVVAPFQPQLCLLIANLLLLFVLFSQNLTGSIALFFFVRFVFRSARLRQLQATVFPVRWLRQKPQGSPGTNHGRINRHAGSSGRRCASFACCRKTSGFLG